MEFDICGILYAVEEKDELDPHTCGECDNNWQKLRINNNQSPLAKKWTLTHELIHAMMKVGGAEDGRSYTEEEICLILQTPLFYLISQNMEVLYEAFGADETPTSDGCLSEAWH